MEDPRMKESSIERMPRWGWDPLCKYIAPVTIDDGEMALLATEGVLEEAGGIGCSGGDAFLSEAGGLDARLDRASRCCEIVKQTRCNGIFLRSFWVVCSLSNMCSICSRFPSCVMVAVNLFFFVLKEGCQISSLIEHMLVREGYCIGSFD